MSIERRINPRQESQKSKILKHLQEGRSITPIEALRDYGCFRLAAIIHVLREDNYNIITNMVKEGDKTYAKYSLSAHQKTVWEDLNPFMAKV